MPDRRATSFQVFTTANDDGTEEFHFNMLGPVGEATDFVELFQVLRNATEEQKVHMYLNTPGGRMDTMIQIINCMQNSKATIVTHLEGLCHSAGTYIFLSGDEFVVNQNTLLLFHNYTGGAFGKGNEIVPQVLANDMWVKQINDDIYHPFLNRAEIDYINSGEDKWMYSEEVVSRLDTVIAEREEEVRKATVRSRIAMKRQVDALVAADEKLAEAEAVEAEALEEKQKVLDLAEAELQLTKAEQLVFKLHEE